MITNADWPKLGACRNDKMLNFYPDLSNPEGKDEEKKALETCRKCEVETKCKEYAMEYEFFGIWGGTTERQREKQRVSSGNKVVTQHFGLRTQFFRRRRNEQ